MSTEHAEFTIIATSPDANDFDHLCEYRDAQHAALNANEVIRFCHKGSGGNFTVLRQPNGGLHIIAFLSKRAGPIPFEELDALLALKEAPVAVAEERSP